MTPINSAALANIEADFERELAEIEAESIGWHMLADGAYLHMGSNSPVIEITGVASAAMANSNVLWLV